MISLNIRYKQLCEKVSALVAKAKATYYSNEAENSKHVDPAKWYKNIYRLAAAEESREIVPPPEAVADLMDYNALFRNLGRTLLQQRFQKIMLLISS